MAFVLTPRFTPAYQAQCSPFGFCAPAPRPAYSYRVARPRPQRPQYSPFNHFFSQVDELLSEIDREAQHQAHLEAQREAHRQRQQRKKALRAKFGVNQTEQGWQIDGEFEGFNQEHINIEVTDENTLKIIGNTRWEAEKAVESKDVPEQQETQAVNVEQQPAAQTPEDTMDGITLNEPGFETVTEADTATVGAATHDSDTESHKSYQATVEDDFEDLGADTSSLVSSTRPSSPTEVKEPKGKEKATEETPSADKAPVAPQPEAGAGTQQDQHLESQPEGPRHGSFERTFRFPERIDGANVSAIFKDGVLKVTVPRAQAQQVRRIAIL